MMAAHRSADHVMLIKRPARRFQQFLALILTMSSTGSLSADPTTSSAPADCTPAFIASNMKALESPDFFIREEASQSLMDCGPGIYETLKQHFVDSPYQDVRRRIFEIAREVFLTQRLGPPRAFLGIQHTASNLRGQVDPRVPADRTALCINHVFRGSAAHRIGLRPGDLIMMLNNAPGTADHPALAFTDWFRQQRPGVKCKLGVFRGGVGLRFQMGDTAGFEPEDFRSIQAQVLRHQTDGRVPVGAGALQIQQLGKVDPRLGLKTGDLIVALDDQLIDAREPWQILMEWTGSYINAGPGAMNPQERMERKRPNPRSPRSKSLQILRGGQWMELDATLRRMPMFLQEIQNPASTHTMNPAAIEPAIAEFNEWWRTQFDPQDRLTNPDEDPRWLLRPQRNWK
jgi:hypothetical protein